MIPLILGVLSVISNVFIITITILVASKYLFITEYRGKIGSNLFYDSVVLSFFIIILFLGHLIQIAVWAAVFIFCGEFNEFYTSIYFSMVNFSSLGYGDIVMSPRWRILGAMEAVNGVLMFGVSTAVMVTVSRRIFGDRIKEMRDKLLNKN